MRCTCCPRVSTRSVRKHYTHASPEAEGDEIDVVPRSDALSYPGAVVVHPEDAGPTMSAVVGPQGLYDLAPAAVPRVRVEGERHWRFPKHFAHPWLAGPIVTVSRRSHVVERRMAWKCRVDRTGNCHCRSLCGVRVLLLRRIHPRHRHRRRRRRRRRHSSALARQAILLVKCTSHRLANSWS